MSLSSRENQLLMGALSNWNKSSQKYQSLKSKRNAMIQWKFFVKSSKLRGQSASFINSLIEKSSDALKSLPNTRSRDEIDTIRQLLKKFLPGAMINLSDEDSYTLCNGVELIEFEGPTILFLQGDIGKHFFLVLKGAIELYSEVNKSREMYLGREYGRHRGKLLPETLRSPLPLGRFLKTLQAGSVFGELAIISETNRTRSCSAVAVGVKPSLVVINEELYNAAIRSYHKRQSNLTIASTLLQEIPAFVGFTTAKIESIAYSMRYVSVKQKTCIAKLGDTINTLYFILQGNINIYPNISTSIVNSITTCTSIVNDKDLNNTPIITAMIPSPAVAQLGYGMVIGETELHQKMKTFQMNYVATTSCKIFEMDIALYEENVCSTAVRQSIYYNINRKENSLLEALHSQRNAMFENVQLKQKKRIAATPKNISLESLKSLLIPTDLFPATDDTEIPNSSIQIINLPKKLKNTGFHIRETKCKPFSVSVPITLNNNSEKSLKYSKITDFQSASRIPCSPSSPRPSTSSGVSRPKPMSLTIENIKKVYTP